MAEEEKRDSDLQRELEHLYQKVASLDPKEDDRQGQIAGPAAEESEEPKRRPPTGKRFRLKEKLRASRTAAPYPVLLLCLLILASLGFSLWPSFYHYDAIDPGGGSYPLRINRLTGEATYYDGRNWVKPPIIPKENKPPAVVEAKVLPPPIVPSGDKISEAPSAPEVRASSAPMPSATGGKTEAIPAPASAAFPKDVRQAPYAVQIRAFPENRMKEAEAFMERVKENRPETLLETATLGKRGVWHRILLGPFSTREEASAYRKENRLSREFPDSFVQKRTGTAP